MIEKFPRRLVLPGMAAALSACAAVPSPTTFEKTDLATSTHLTPGSRVYVYSFLSARAGFIGPATVRELEKDVTALLQRHQVTTAILRLADTDEGKYLVKDTATINVPVGRVLHENAGAEGTFHPAYRLMMFPAETRPLNGGAAYTITYRLVDVATGREVWFTRSQSSFFNWVTVDQDSIERAAGMTAGLETEMVRYNLF